MKKTLLLKTMLLLCAFIVGSNSVWADDDVTITMSQQGWSNDTQIGSGTLKLANGSNSIFTYSSGTGSDGANAGPKYYDNGAEVRFYSKKNGNGQGNWMQINVPQNTTITGVELTGVSDYTPDVKYNVDGGSDVSWTASNNKYTVSNISAKTNFTFRNAKTGSTNTQLRITAIKITYTTASSYTITAESNNTNYGTVTLSGSVITGSPNAGYRYADPAYTVSPANSATVSQNGDNFTVTPSANTTVTINFEAIPTYTVTLGDDLSTLTEATGGAGVTLPTRSTLNGYDFAGWSETNVSTETTEAPTIIPAGAYAPTNDITLYPIYTKTTGGGGTAHETASVTIADYATANNWDNGVQYASVTLDENVKASATGGGNTGKYYTSGNEWRFYQNEDAKVTISTTSGELKSVTFTFNINNGGTLNYGSSKITSGTAVDVSGTSAEFTVGNSGTATNGQIKITAISVNYDITGVGTTYYWSSPVAAAVETPSIVVADNPFLFSTTATITCATEGATIKYSYDGENWNDYSAELTITETKTIYAKAVKGEDVSSVAQVTATKNLAEATVTVSGDLTLDLDGGTDVNAGTLTAAVTYNNVAIEGATVTWSGDNDAVATIDASTGAVTIKTTGEVTFTATYAGNSDYAEATNTKTITVTDSKAPGTADNPYTVAEAIAYINTLGTSLSPTEVYVHGIISQVDEFDSQHSSITYWISDDGTTTGQMEVYSGKGLNGADFSALTDLVVGDVVTVKGKVKNYNSTPEFDKNNQLISLIRKVATPTFSPAAGAVAQNTTVTISTATDEATIYYTTDGSDPTTESTKYTEPIVIDAAKTIKAFAVKEGLPDSEIAEAAYTIAVPCATPTFSVPAGTYEAVQSVELATITEDASIYYTTNGSDPTTASTKYTAAITVDQTMTIKAIAVKEGMANSEVAEAAYTINLPDYATLPFAYDDGKSTLPLGLTENGLGNDYTSSPKLRFDGDGDNLVLKINEVPGTLSFKIKGNGAGSTPWAGTYKVQTSANGEDYIDLATYTELSGSATTLTFNNLGADVRYIKWIYVEKVTGNVALGDIKLSNTIDVTIPAGKEWITFCSTANLDFSEAIEGLKGAYTITAHESQAITLTATEMTGAVKAGTGLLLRAAAVDNTNDQVITIPVAATGDEQPDNMLIGVTEDTDIQPTDGDYTHLGLSNGEFHPYSEAGTLAAGKAYLQILTAQMPKAPGAKLIIVFDGETTGIANLNLNDNDNFDANAPMYNLAGQRVNKSYKGVVIVNGKKVVRK